MRSLNSRNICEQLVRNHLRVIGSFDHYSGVVTLHGLTRLATETGDAELIAESRNQLMPYVRGEREYYANFPHYFCGGNASAWLLYRGHLPEAEEPVRRYAEHLMHEQPRDSQGIYKHPAKPEEERIWIDVAFAVSPFLLFAGLHFDEPRYIQEAWEQTAKMVEALRCDETGLFFQCRGFLGPGKLSEDHWSRGNGWGAYALTELARYLPEDHPAKADAIRLYREHVDACARVQGEEDGLWRQEMLEPTRAYVETSGSGLLLYAVGAGLEGELLDKTTHQPRLEKGLRGLVPYVTDNGDVFHCCKGCLCPGDGSKTAYRATPPVYNDWHAFGPMVLAFGQAHLLGITQVSEKS